MSDGIIAITGGTGFIGQHLVARLADQGKKVRLLVRKPEAANLLSDHQNVEIVRGNLNDRSALDTLTYQAETLLHLASKNFAVNQAEFDRVNAAGTRNVMESAQASAVDQLIYLSSLAAREPNISGYAASKACAEQDLQRLCADRSPFWVIVRPPAVYGPGDKATLPLLQALTHKFALLPGQADSRFSLIYVEDLVDAIIGLIGDSSVNSQTIELDDGTPGGYDWLSLARIAGEVRGKSVKPIFLPKKVMNAAAGAVEFGAKIVDKTPPLARNKVQELYHPNWVCEKTGLQDSGNWSPKIQFSEGFKKTVDWYRAKGWM